MHFCFSSIHFYCIILSLLVEKQLSPEISDFHLRHPEDISFDISHAYMRNLNFS